VRGSVPRLHRGRVPVAELPDRVPAQRGLRLRDPRAAAAGPRRRHGRTAAAGRDVVVRVQQRDLLRRRLRQEAGRAVVRQRGERQNLQNLRFETVYDLQDE